MKVVGLVSGGKDSCFGMMQCVAAGHSLVALANLQPGREGDLDSYMYQSVGHEGIEAMAEAMGLPLYRQSTHGHAKQKGRSYRPEEGDEVEDLYSLLSTVQLELGVDAVSVGAILSDYQRVRVENVCSRLGLTTFAFLWQRDQTELLAEMVDSGVQAILVKVAALGLDPAVHLGRDIADVAPHLLHMKEKWGLNVCGEGGEYETFTLDCPLFKKAIIVDDYETVIQDDNAIAPVGYLCFKKIRLVDKTATSIPFCERLSSFKKVQASLDTCTEEVCEEERADVIVCKDGALQEDKLLNTPNVLTNASGWCWVTGVAGKGSSCREAVVNAFDALQELLAMQRLELSDVVGISLWLRDLQEFADVNAVFRSRLASFLEPPVRACVEAALPGDWPILLEVTAHRSVQGADDSGEDYDGNRHALHVQSLSHWAPASIGPYSQAVRVGNIVQVAGQIALEPCTGQLIGDASVGAECLLSLRHVSRILAAVDPRLELQDVVQGVCYLTNAEAVQTVRKMWETRTTNAIVDFIIVPALPRGAQVEWCVWAHSHNRRFEYEETGCRLAVEGVETSRASIRSRWNYDSTVAAVVCYVEGSQNEASIKFAIDYALSKLLRDAPANSVISMRIYYRLGSVNTTELGAAVQAATQSLRQLGSSLGCSFIPVCSLHDQHTVVSLCGLRYQ